MCAPQGENAEFREGFLEEGFNRGHEASQVALVVKSLPANAGDIETQV